MWNIAFIGPVFGLRTHSNYITWSWNPIEYSCHSGLLSLFNISYKSCLLNVFRIHCLLYLDWSLVGTGNVPSVTPLRHTLAPLGSWILRLIAFLKLESPYKFIFKKHVILETPLSMWKRSSTLKHGHPNQLPITSNRNTVLDKMI